MRLSTAMSLVTLASIGMALWGLLSFYRSLAPIPSNLQSIAGTASAVESSTLRYSKSHVTFRLTQASGSAVDFSYTPAFKRFYYFAEHLKDGMTVEVKIGPNGRNDIWGLKLEAETLMTPETAREARRADGWWGLVLFFGLMISAVWTGSQVPKWREKGI